jgi:hypothetical protein
MIFSLEAVTHFHSIVHRKGYLMPRKEDEGFEKVFPLNSSVSNNFFMACYDLIKKILKFPFFPLNSLIKIKM